MSQLPGTPRSVENGQNDFVGKTQVSSFIVVINVVNTLTHLVLGAVALSAIIFANLFSQTTSLKQHIYLCVTGYIILMSQAVLAFNPQAGWTSMLKYQEKKLIHLLMQVAGSILALVGSVIRITAINNHLETTHGILGIIAMVMTFLSLLGGLSNLFSMKMKINPMFVKTAHSCLGCLTLIVAFLCLVFAFNKDLYRSTIGDINANLSISLTVIALVGTITSACISNIKRMFR